MAYIQINSAGDVYDALETDAIFGGYLGTVTFPDGEVPALMTAVTGNPLDGIDQINGLLVVIDQDPTVTSRRLLTPQVVITKEFRIRLIQIGDENRTLNEAVNRCAEIFPGCSIANIGNPDELAGAGQAVVTLPPNTVAVV